MTLSYTFYGNIDTDYEAWEKWIADTYEIFEILGYHANYYGFSVENKADFKLHPITGIKRKLTNAKRKTEKIRNGCICVLPDNFRSVAFDYIITLSRCAGYETLILNQEYKMNLDETKIIALLRRNIHATSGEVYEMDIDDCPEFYAAKANPGKPIQSYKKIATLE